MPNCPVCKVSLRAMREREGVYFACGRCGGRGVTVPQIGRFAGDRFAAHILRHVNHAVAFSDRMCPFCGKPMRRFTNAEPRISLDACRPCTLVWFDPKEFEAIPEGA